MQLSLFEQEVSLESKQLAKNLTDPIVQRTILICFEQAINNQTIKEKDNISLLQHKKLSASKQFWIKNRSHSRYEPQYSIFNMVVGDSEFEIEFAQLLDYLAQK